MAAYAGFNGAEHLPRQVSNSTGYNGGWAIRSITCRPGVQVDCGIRTSPYHACCMAGQMCAEGDNASCCPTRQPCNDTLSTTRIQCADPTWTLCDNDGPFCCMPDFVCYIIGRAQGSGCGPPGYKLASDEYPAKTLRVGTVSASGTSSIIPTTASISSSSPSQIPTSPIPKSQTPIGAIVGGSLGGFLGGVCSILLGLWIWNKKRRKTIIKTKNDGGNWYLDGYAPPNEGDIIDVAGKIHEIDGITVNEADGAAINEANGISSGHRPAELES